MIAYKHLFDDARPISLDELDLYGIPPSTIEELRDTWEDVLSTPRLDPRDFYRIDED
ncbi:MAG: hypothetical protein KL863_16100 [Rhizobium sp.]|nr:hypothetical protein [Rhizobium sp.]